MNKPRLWFAGTPRFAALAMQKIIVSSDYCLDLVLTQPDRPKGRGRKLQKSEVKVLAEQHGFPVLQMEKFPRNLDEFCALAAESGLDLPNPPDMVIVAAYGLLLPSWFLVYPRFACINIHASLLPRWRGAAPIQRAIEAGDRETGISIMQMAEGLDTGAVWLRRACPIAADMDSIVLHDCLSDLAGEAILQALPLILAGNTEPEPQDEAEAIYAAKLSKAEAQIDWQQNAVDIARKIRAFALAPVAYSFLDSEMLRIYEAGEVSLEDLGGKFSSARLVDIPVGSVIYHGKEGVFVCCGDCSVLALRSLQFAGKKRLTAEQIRNGRDLTGLVFA